MSRADELEQLAETFPFDSAPRKLLRSAATELEQALHQRAGLRKALEVYAKPEFYEALPAPSLAVYDLGQVARNALHVLFPE